MLRRVLVLALAAFAGACAAPSNEQPPASTPAAPPLDRVEAIRDVTWVLDDLHDAAAHADEPRYFSHFASDAVFLGTDATERWDVTAFKAYAHPRFSTGHGWVFHSTRRVVSLSSDGALAWFDEDLTGEKLGAARGSGVLRRDGGNYVVVQYNLALTIPNDRFEAIHAIVDPPAAVAAVKKSYDAAVAAAGAGDLAQARKLLHDVLPLVRARPDEDAEFWLHNQLTWVEWADGRPAEALREADESKIAAIHTGLPSEQTRALLLHHYWDRAYLLRDVATAGHDEKKLLQSALDAKAEYDARAREAHDDDGMNVLATFFAVRKGDAKAALEAAKKVDAAKDSDLQDLYVLALGYELAKDGATASALRARICAAKPYLMKPLITRALAKEGHTCP